ncbi:type II toxin-antitoxin system PemK/MazF family toxin [Microbacterium sp. NIBRBAC000506063]|uniref:type II toxin-antitoxin system PemK/MazF family toxin n=1 Tax=Microbacterium sp. NIBRBAC000506063 TaxID=2734618 RepID=UPI002948B8CB|nr:type II toxin-antitoxin system PemK/MazF family toxin [Microbacterium sp. NIBRBAC000506063]
MMREICLARLDKTRPVVILTRDAARVAMTKVTVAPITSTIKGSAARFHSDGRTVSTTPARSPSTTS